MPVITPCSEVGERAYFSRFESMESVCLSVLGSIDPAVCFSVSWECLEACLLFHRRPRVYLALGGPHGDLQSEAIFQVSTLQNQQTRIGTEKGTEAMAKKSVLPRL